MRLISVCLFFLVTFSTIPHAQESSFATTFADVNDTATKKKMSTEKPVKTIYFLSGLGADARVFKNLVLPGYDRVYIEWIGPLPKETIAQYATRIKSQITTERPVIIGLSFGGMIAIEIAKQIPETKVILISSAKTKRDLIPGNKLFFKLKLYKIIPGFMIKHTNFLVNNLFGVKTKEDKEILKAVMKETDVHFFRWAVGSIAQWDNEVVPPQVIQIHGTADRMIPNFGVEPDYTIDGGGHMMVLNKADTISKIILDHLRN